VSLERSPSIVERRGLWLLVAILVVLWLARAVIGPFVVAAVLAYAFTPVVGAVQRRTGWPRLLIVAIGYMVAIALLLLAIVVLGQKLLDELGALSRRGPDSLAVALREIIGSDSIAVGGQSISVLEIAHQLQAGIAAAIGSPSDALHLASLIGEFVLNAVLALIVLFYFLLDGDRMRAFALRLVSVDRRERVAGILDRIHEVLGRWLRGQLFLIVLVADLVQYWTHRAYHEIPFLWRFHAVHHSAEYMDWMAGSRLHLFELLTTRVSILGVLYVLGFSEASMNVYIVIVGFQAVFNHANVRLPEAFGRAPLKWLVVTPDFHHWHHSSEREAIDRNYAAHFAFIDYIFGTAVKSDRRFPGKYGVLGDYMPASWLRQQLFPFTWKR